MNANFSTRYPGGWSTEKLKSDVEKSDSRREYGDRPYDEFRAIIGELTEFRALEGLQQTKKSN